MGNSDVRIRGNGELHVDQKGLEARLSISKEENGQEWSVDALKQFLSQKGVVGGFSDASLDAALKEAAGAEERTVTVTVAEGSSPEDPQPERVTTDDLPIPEELAETAEELLGRAGQPEIVVYKTQTVEREKVVEKNRALPFLAKKQERVTVTEKESVPENVYVDPTVEWTGYAEEGHRLAVVTPQEPGRAGTNVYGSQVQPRRLADAAFYAGGGVVRKKNELFAERSGFVRRGANWMDIVPFTDHEWHLGTSKDQVTCLLTFHPGHSSADPPTGDEVLAEAQRRGFPEERLLGADELDTMISEALKSGSALVEKPITVSRDADFSIYVSEDRLKAVLSVHKGLGRGKPLVLRELGKAIQNSGLKRLNLEQIKSDIMAFYQGPETDLTGYVLTEGKAPVPGPEREIEWSVRFLPHKEVERLYPGQSGDDSGSETGSASEAFPVGQVSIMGHVSEEQRIASIPPPVAGEGGIDVYGQTIPAETPPEPPLQYWEGVRREKNMLIATRAGLFECAVVDGVHHLRVRLHRDARVTVDVSEDRMKAFISLDPGEGSGKPITDAEVRQAVTDAGVTHGIREEVLEKAVQEASRGTVVDRTRFAEGTPPENETTPRVEFLVQMASGKPLTTRSDGSIDYKNQDRISSVEAEQQIAKVLPPEQAPQDGTDVTGRRIPARRSTGAPLSAGTNVRTDQVDGAEVLVSEIAGEIQINQRVVSVVSQHTVKGDIDLSTGNVKFPGSVQISGNVRSGFYVMAGGDIRVGEGVEAALLSADGDVLIKQGIKGGGKGVIRSKKNIGASFSERATLLSVGDIVLKNSCVHSQVKCNGTLTVTAKNGSILGGEVRARKGLSVTNLGSQTGTRTVISFGQDYLIADQIEREEQAVEKIKQQISQLDIQMHQKEKEGNASERDRLRQEKKKQLKIIEKRSLRLFTLREKFEHHYTSHVDIYGTVYPGVVIESHGRQHEFRQQKTKVRVSFNLETGHIEEGPLQRDTEKETQTP
jgi:hypothetical protein